MKVNSKWTQHKKGTTKTRVFKMKVHDPKNKEKATSTAAKYQFEKKSNI